MGQQSCSLSSGLHEKIIDIEAALDTLAEPQSEALFGENSPTRNLYAGLVPMIQTSISPRARQLRSPRRDENFPGGHSLAPD